MLEVVVDVVRGRNRSLWQGSVIAVERLLEGVVFGDKKSEGLR